MLETLTFIIEPIKLYRGRRYSIMRVYEKFDKTSENREPSRAYYIPYDSLEKALEGKKKIQHIISS